MIHGSPVHPDIHKRAGILFLIHRLISPHHTLNSLRSSTLSNTWRTSIRYPSISKELFAEKFTKNSSRIVLLSTKTIGPHVLIHYDFKLLQFWRDMGHWRRSYEIAKKEKSFCSYLTVWEGWGHQNWWICFFTCKWQYLIGGHWIWGKEASSHPLSIYTQPQNPSRTITDLHWV